MRIYTYRNSEILRVVPWPWIILGLLIAALTIMVVLPLAGIFIALVLGIAAVGVIALVVGLPAYLLGWFLLSILLLPFGILKSIFWRRRTRIERDR